MYQGTGMNGREVGGQQPPHNSLRGSIAYGSVIQTPGNKSRLKW